MRLLLCEESGQGMVEYSLILAGIALLVFLAYKGIGNSNKNRLENFQNMMPR